MKIQLSTVIFFVCTIFFFLGIATILNGDIESVKGGLMMAGLLTFFVSVMLSVKSKAMARSASKVRLPE